MSTKEERRLWDELASSLFKEAILKLDTRTLSREESLAYAKVFAHGSFALADVYMEARKEHLRRLK